MSQTAKKNTMLAILIILFIAMLIYPLYVLGVFSGDKAEYPVNKEAPTFEWEDVHLGQPVSLAGTNDTVRLVYFYYSYCPDVCPPSTYALSVIQERLKKDNLFDKVKIFSITFDPERDTPERIKEFAGNFEVDSNGWHFLRGEEEDVRTVAKQYGIDVIESPNGDLAHQNFYFLIDKDGNIRKLIGAMDPDIDQVLKDIKGLL